MACNNNNNRRGSKCRFISERLYDIRYSNDVLNKGLSELEALYLKIQTGKVANKTQAKENVTILSGQNQYLAQAINSALKEVESILRKHVEGGSSIHKETIHEFSEVLKESIRILHDYRNIQEGYSNSLNDLESNTSSDTIYLHGKCKRGSQSHNHRRKAPIFQRVIQTFCICGTGINF